MPCLNEAETLEICIKKAFQGLKNSNITGEVVIADNGSTDGSIEIALKNGARVVHVKEKGYGSALRGGIESANGKYIIMADADDSYDFLKLDLFVEKLREGNDMVVGNRFKGGIEKGAMPFLHYYLGNPVLSFVGKLFFKIPINDFHCGIRGFSKEAYFRMKLQTTGMEFASEMIVKSSLNKLKITEVPTTLAIDGRTRPPHLRTWRDGWRHLRFLLLFAPIWLFLLPGLFFIITGGVFATSLLISPITIKNIQFDISSLLYACSAIIIGFQITYFYVFCKVYATNSNFIPVDEHNKFLRFEWLTIEKGILFSFLLLFFGFYLSFKSISYWSNLDFGNLNPSISLRYVIPASTFIILGIQSLFGSFFLGILRIKIH